MTAHQHATLASMLLETENELDARLAALSPEERIQYAALGQTTRLNRDRQFSIELAQAHALAAIALVLTVEV